MNDTRSARKSIINSNTIVWHNHYVSKQQRANIKTQTPCVLWFTGLSASGKSTLANAVEVKLHALGKHTYLLDGDNIRMGLNKTLGFTEKDRIENIRRVTEVCKLFVDAGLIVLAAFISPFQSDRNKIRNLLAAGEFIEIFVDTPLAVCEQRDPKGLYQKARAGMVENFTGITSPYEAPTNAEIHIDNSNNSIEKNVQTIITYLQKKGYLAC